MYQKQVFIIRKIVQIFDRNDLYWISRQGEEKIIDKRFFKTRIVYIKMESIFIYYNNLSFDEKKKRSVINFENEKELKGVYLF